jgi:foldase protein PrsA
MAQDPDIKESKKPAKATAHKASSKPAQGKKPEAKPSKSEAATETKATASESTTKQQSFQDRLHKLGVKNGPNKKTVGLIVGGVVAVILLTIIAFGVAIYKYKQTNRAVRIVASVVPYPVSSVNGNVIWNTTIYKDYLFELASVKKFYTSQGQDLNSAEGKKKLAQLKQDLIKQQEDNLLVEQAARKYKIVVTNKEVDAEFNELVKNAGGIDKVKSTLDKLYGWTVDDFREKVRESIVQKKLGEKIAADPSLNGGAQKQAEDILKQVRGGGDFAELAKKYSQDGSASNGGDLGFFGKGQMVPEFEQAAFALETGAVSGIVKTQYGYHIIKVTDKKDDQVKASHILIKGTDLESWLKAQRTKAKIKQYFRP